MMNDRVVVPVDRVTVSITGAIELPGEYELLRGATVADLVNQAGGPTPYANRRRMMVRQPDMNGEYTSMAVTFEEGMLVTLRDNAVVRVLSSYGSGSAIVVEGAVFGKPADGDGPITLPTALPSNSAELRTGLPAPIPIRLVLPFYPGMTVYDALYAVGGPTPFARTADSYVVRAGERIELDAAALWDGDGLHGDLPLQPRDQVVVPAAEVFVTVLGLGQPPRRDPLPARSHRQRLPAAGRRAYPRGRPGTGPLRGQDRPQPARRGARRPGDQRRHPDRRTPSDPAPAGRHPARRPHHQPVQQHGHGDQHRQRLDRSLRLGWALTPAPSVAPSPTPIYHAPNSLLGDGDFRACAPTTGCPCCLSHARNRPP